MTPDLDGPHLEVTVVWTPLGWLLTGVLIIPINGILKIRNGEMIQANHFMGFRGCFTGLLNHTCILGCS